MSTLPLEVIEMLGQTMAKVAPITIGLALIFTVLSHFWSCNPGAPWWRKRELLTDICYWFFVPVFARVLRRLRRPPRFTTAPFAWTSATSDVRNLSLVISNCKRDLLRNFLNSGCIRCCDRPAALVGGPAFDRVLKAGLEDRLLTGGKLSWRAWPSNPPCLPSAPPRRPSPCPRRPPAPPSAWMS